VNTFRISTRILATVGILVVVLLVAEILLRLADYPPPIPSGWGWDRSPRRGLADTGDSGQNELGLRGNSFSYRDGDVVVLLVGDSNVEAAASSWDKMPERLLEAHLSSSLPSRSFKVFSLASSGWGQDQQLLALERYFKTYRADLVLIWAQPVNDFWENTFPDRNEHIKPTFWFGGRSLQGPFFHDAVYLSRVRLWDLAIRAKLQFRHRSITQHVLNEWVTRLPSDDRALNEARSAHCANLPALDQQNLAKDIFTLSDERRVMVRTKEDVEHSRSHFSPYILPRSAKDEYLIEITRALMARLKTTTEAHHAAFRVFYPIRPDFDDLGKRGVRCIESPTGKQFEAQWDMVSLLRSLVNRHDLIEVTLRGGEELSVGPTDRHFSTAGNDQAMQLLAQELLRQDLIQP